MKWAERLFTIAVIAAAVAIPNWLQLRHVQRLSFRVDSLAVTLNGMVQRNSRGSAPTTARVSRNGVLAIGDSTASITVIEFLDYECPYCKKFARSTLPTLRARYFATGKARFVIRDLPLPMHTNAMDATSAVRCAAKQGEAFGWKLHDAFMAQDSPLSKRRILDIASGTAVNVSTLRACMEDDGVRKAIITDVEYGARSSFSGTPTFVIGRTDVQGNVDGAVLRGLLSTERFDSLLAQLVRNVQVTERPQKPQI